MYTAMSRVNSIAFALDSLPSAPLAHVFNHSPSRCVLGWVMEVASSKAEQ